MKKPHHDKAAERLIEEQLYAQVVQELVGGQRRDGLWAKAISDSDGSEEKAKSLKYSKYSPYSSPGGQTTVSWPGARKP